MKSATYWNQQAIEQALIRDPEATYLNILGEPKKRSSRSWRYDNGLIVTLKGQRAGQWYSFTENQGGGPVQALQLKGLTFKEALRQGAALAGLSNAQGIIQARMQKTVLQTPEQTDVQRQQTWKLQRARVKAAQSIWAGTHQLQSTLAERYLREHRNIMRTDTLQMRYWPPQTAWQDHDEQGSLVARTNKMPALVVAVRDAVGRLGGVQRIYLDVETANQTKRMANAKVCKGLIAGAAGIIQLGRASGRLYLTEGPETGAAIASVDRKATVLTSLSVCNLARLSKVIQRYRPREVILAADNDGENAPSRITTAHAFEQLQRELSGIASLQIIYPNLLPGYTKTDWNDVLKQQGAACLKQQISQALQLASQIKKGL